MSLSSIIAVIIFVTYASTSPHLLLGSQESTGYLPKESEPSLPLHNQENLPPSSVLTDVFSTFDRYQGSPQIISHSFLKRDIPIPVVFPGDPASPAGTWAAVPCLTPIIVAPVENPEIQWTFAGAQDAWEQLNDAFAIYLGNPSPPPGWELAADLPEYAAWAFHWPVENSHCSNPQSSACDTPPTCSNQMSAAGWLILNSFVNIHDMVIAANNAMRAAALEINTYIETFGLTFAPLPGEQGDQLSEIFTALSSLISIGVGINWTAMLKGAAEAATIGTKPLEEVATSKIEWGSIGESGYDAAVAQFGAITPSTDPDLATMEQAQEFSTMLSAYASAVANGQMTWFANVVSGKASGYRQILTELFANGSLNAAYDREDFNASTVAIESSTKFLYGSLVPMAWKTLENAPRPFVLRVDRSDYACGTPLSGGCNANTMSPAMYALCQNIESDIFLETQFCDASGNTWFLLSANYLSRSGGGVFTKCPGAQNSVLDGSAWGGLTIRDMILSSYAGFVANGHKNGYRLAQNAAWFPDDTLTLQNATYPFEGGVTTPGLFNFTICLSALEAVDTIQKGNSDMPPCGIIPQTSDISPPQNADRYNSGWCGVHVWQSQPDPSRDDGGNLSQFYQLEVLIKDNVQYQIGYATKQTANRPLIVQSRLPFNFIAAAGSQYNDTLCMWYANQYWCSDSSQCSFGSYSNGVREGDCGFACPAPSIIAPSSTTLVRPTSAVTALNGNPTTFTRVSTANPATWTPSYTTGWCGIHVRQYQRNEYSDHENPYNNYAIEVTVFDAADPPSIIIQPFQQQVLTLGYEILQGPLPYPLEVGVGWNDDDPVYFKYRGQSWNSSPDNIENFSSQGSWDSGHRDVNSGFSC